MCSTNSGHHSGGIPVHIPELLADRAGIQRHTVPDTGAEVACGAHLQAAGDVLVVAPVGHVGDVRPAGLLAQSEPGGPECHQCAFGDVKPR